MLEIWLHRCAQKLSRQGQSQSVRSLLALALAQRNITLCPAQLALPGLQLTALLRQRQLSLSISHCNGLLCCALGKGESLGVDCESGQRQRDWAALAQCYFSPGEAAAIAAQSDAAQTALFLRHWVLKEAFIKAVGGSVFTDLQALSLEANGRIRLRECYKPNDWRRIESQCGGIPLAVLVKQAETSQARVYESSDFKGISERPSLPLRPLESVD